MATGILSIIGVILTVIGPAVAAILLHKWEEKRAQQINKEVRNADKSIIKLSKGNKAGLIELTTQLDRLHRKSRRKVGRRS